MSFPKQCARNRWCYRQRCWSTAKITRSLLTKCVVVMKNIEHADKLEHNLTAFVSSLPATWTYHFFRANLLTDKWMMSSWKTEGSKATPAQSHGFISDPKLEKFFYLLLEQWIQINPLLTEVWKSIAVLRKKGQATKTSWSLWNSRTSSCPPQKRLSNREFAMEQNNLKAWKYEYRSKTMQQCHKMSWDAHV